MAAESDGRSAAVFDLDPQASAAFWKDTREAEAPAVIAVPSAGLQHVLRAAAGSGCTLAIIDAPPFAKDIAFEAAQHADFILIPTRPAVLDVMAMTKTLELVRHYAKLSSVVLTFCPAQGREVADTEGAVKQLGAILAPVRIHNRVAYSRAQQTGLTAQELEPDGKAATRLNNYTRLRVCTYTEMMLGRAMPMPRNSLQAVLERQARNPAEEIPATPNQAGVEVRASSSPKFHRPSRERRRLVAGHFDPKVAKQLKLLAAEEETTVQNLLEEALDLLFVKKGRGTIKRE